MGIDAANLTILWTKLPFFFNPAGLQADLAKLEAEMWMPHYNQRDYDGDWNSLSLRSMSGRANDILSVGGPDSYRDTPVMAMCQHMRAAVEAFPFPKTSVRLLRLGAGARIKEHVDRDLGLADGELRIHVPVTTNDKMEFVVSERRLILQPGEAWYIDFSKPHRIYNGGDTDRVHLVIDGVVNAWVLETLERSSREIVTESFAADAKQQLVRFREQVFADASLQSELLLARDRTKLMEAMVAAGERLGYSFKARDVDAMQSELNHSWNARKDEL
jgi:hypothetical protein